MKRTTLFFSICLLGAANATAQVDFLKTYGLPNRNETLVAILPAAEPGYYWAAGTTGAVGNDDYFRVKLDANGQVLLADTLGSPLHNETLTGFDVHPVTGDCWYGAVKQTFSLSTPQLVALRTDSTGQVLTEIQVPNGGYSPDRTGVYVRAMDDRGAIVISFHKPNIRVMRYSAEGQLIWQNTVAGGSSTELLNKAAITPEGRVFLLLSSGFISSDNANTRLVHLDPAGQLVWEKNIFGPGGENRSTPYSLAYDAGDNSVVVLHRQITPPLYNWLSKLDLQGNILWQTSRPTVNGNLYPAHLILGENNEIGILPYRSLERYDRTTGAFLGIQDSTSSYLSPFLFNAGLILADGSLVAVGETTVDAGSFDGYFARIHPTDSTQNVERAIGNPGPDGEDDYPRLARTADGGYYMGNRAHFGIGRDMDFLLRKIDSDGTQIWEYNFGSESIEVFSDLATLSDGSCLLAGEAFRLHDTLPDHLLLYKIDPDGQLVWEKRFPKRNLDFGIFTVPMPDGGAVVLFRSVIPTTPPDPLQVFQTQGLRLSADGDTLWERRYFEGAPDTYRTMLSLETLADGTLVSTGLCANCTGHLLRIDPSDGAPLLATDLETGPEYNSRRTTSAVLAGNGDLLVMGINHKQADSVFLYRLAPDGAILQRENLKFGQFHYGSSLIRAADGGLLAVMAADAGSQYLPTNLRVLRLTEDFEPLSETLLSNAVRRPNDVLALPDGSLAFTGTIKPSNSDDVLLLKTLPVPTVSAQDVSAATFRFDLAPNPLPEHASLQLLLESDFTGPMIVETLYPDGRRATIQEIVKTTRRAAFTLNALPASGPFIVRLSNGRHTAARWVLRF